MKTIPLYLVVSLSGASVLSLEILGTRILGPFYGASIFLWTALISVALAALALGYALGGRLADRGPTAQRLGLILLGAAIWVFLIPLLKRPLLLATEPLGLRTAILTTSFFLFFPPLLLMGMVSPYAIRLKISRIEDAGKTAGDLYAISTVASVVAAIATGFVLVPGIGVNRLILLIGAALLLAAGIALLQARSGSKMAAVLLLLLAPAGAAAGWGPMGHRPDLDRGLAAITESEYAEIRILEKNDMRLFLIDGGVHTMIEPGSWMPFHRYAVVTETFDKLFPAPGKMLLFGLGGGSVVKSFKRLDWQIDAVELDPEVTRMALRYFGLEEDEARYFHMDARRFLAESTEQYDFIMGDAYGSGTIPWQLLTKECFEAMNARLAPNGVVALNIESVGWEDDIIRSTTATLRTIFPHVLSLPTSEPPTALGNMLVVASHRPIELPGDLYDVIGHPKDSVPDSYHHWSLIEKTHAWANAYVPAYEGAPIMTDDRTPVDLWGERINRVARKELHEYFGRDGLSW
jgi:spermidine synthase